MAWSLVMTILLESAQSDATTFEKRVQRNAEKQRENAPSSNDGGILASEAIPSHAPKQSKQEMLDMAFGKIMSANSSWTYQVFTDAVNYAQEEAPREHVVLQRELSLQRPEYRAEDESIREEFIKTVWSSLRNRGWKRDCGADDVSNPQAVSTTYSYRNETVSSWTR